MRNFILIMSLSGTSILIIFCIVDLFAKKYVGIRCRQIIIRMAILFYLLPFPLLKYLILSNLCKVLKFISGSKSVSTGLHYFLNNSYIIYKTDKSVYLSKYEFVLMAILAVSAITVVFAVGIEIHNYLKIKQLIKYYSSPITLDEKLSQIITKMKIHKEISFFKNEYTTQPLTTGIFSSVILLPEEVLHNCNSIELIIRHELAHIKYNDVLWHMLGILVIVMHWYNPFSFVLFYCLNEIDEIHSDFLATSNLGDEQKLNYCTDLIALSTKQEIKLPNIIASFMGASSTKQIKRRIDAIMKKKRISKKAEVFIKAFSFAMALGIGLLYQTPTVIQASEQDIWENDSDIEEIILGKYSDITNFTIRYDDYVVVQNGDIYEIKSQDSKAICNHSYEEGTRVTHKKNSNGGCTSKTYEASICIYCRKVITKDLIKTETYKKCPH